MYRRPASFGVSESETATFLKTLVGAQVNFGRISGFKPFGRRFRPNTVTKLKK